MAGDGSASADPQAAAKNSAQQVMTLGNEIDRAILAIAQIAKSGAAELGQARQLIQAGIAKYMAEQGSLGGAGGGSAAPATATGERFPGGGFGGIR